MILASSKINSSFLGSLIPFYIELNKTIHMPKQISYSEIKSGAIILSGEYCRAAYSLWGALRGDYSPNHAMLFVKEENKVTDLVHLTLGKEQCARRHTLFHMAWNVGPTDFSTTDFLVFNPLNNLGELAMKQAIAWMEWGLVYDVKKYNLGRSFKKNHYEADTVASRFDVAQVLKLVYRQHVARTRIKPDNPDQEIGMTCHGFIMDCYNTVWLSALIKRHKIAMSFPSKIDECQFISVKHAKLDDSKLTVTEKQKIKKKRERPYFFTKDNAYIRIDVKAKRLSFFQNELGYETKVDAAIHPFNLLNDEAIQFIKSQAVYAPFPICSTLATSRDLYDVLCNSTYFESPRVLDKTSLINYHSSKRKTIEENDDVLQQVTKNRGR